MDNEVYITKNWCKQQSTLIPKEDSWNFTTMTRLLLMILF